MADSRENKEFSKGSRFGGRDRDSRDQDDDSKPKRLLSSAHSRRKVCRFCTDSDFVLDYRNGRVMQSFITEHGKIVPRRISGNCAPHQRELTIAVKRARVLAFIGYNSAGA